MGGSMGVTQGMLEEFGAERVRNTPISEMAIVGAGIGAAMQGMRPVVEIMYEDFLTLAIEQIVNQAAKHRYMSGGQVKVPLTIRTQGGAGWSPGAQHAQQLEAWFVHVPGLKVVFASIADRRARPALVVDLRRQPRRSSSSTGCSTRSRRRCPTKLEPIPLGKARVAPRGRGRDRDRHRPARARARSRRPTRRPRRRASRSRSSTRARCSRSTRTALVASVKKTNRASSRTRR